MLDVVIFVLINSPAVYFLIFSTWLNFFLYCVFLYVLYVLIPSFFGLKYVLGADSVWFAETPTNLRYNQGALILDRMTKEDILKLATTRGVASQEKFQYTYTEIFGRVFWVKEKAFKAEKHIVFHETHLKNLDELYKFNEDLYVQKISQDISPWQIHFIEKYEEDKSVMIFKSHHALCDGIALISLIVASSDPVETKDSYIRFKRGSALATLFYYIKSLIVFPYLAFIVFTRKEPYTPIHGPKLSGKKSVAVSKDIPLTKLKNFCYNHSISINECILAYSCGGLQKYLADRDSRPKTLAIGVPFSLRTLPPDNSCLPLINDISFLIFDAPFNISEAERIPTFHKICSGLKHSSEPFANHMSQKIIGTVMPTTLKNHFVNDFGNRTSFFFTNVPGPRREIKYMGKRLHKIFFGSPQSGEGALSICSFSYNGNLTVGVTCDKGLVPEAKTLVEYIEKELEIINE